MALSMNRYIGNSILPLLIKHSKFYSEAENYASLLDATLHTVYRLSKNRMLTKGQREAVSDFLVALTSQMQPAMLLKLLRKLTVDVSKLSEYTTVALRVSTRTQMDSNIVIFFRTFLVAHTALWTLCQILRLESRTGHVWRIVRRGETSHNDAVLEHIRFAQQHGLRSRAIRQSFALSDGDWMCVATRLFTATKIRRRLLWQTDRQSWSTAIQSTANKHFHDYTWQRFKFDCAKIQRTLSRRLGQSQNGNRMDVWRKLVGCK